MTLFALSTVLSVGAAAQGATAGTSLTFVPGSSVKLEQIIGDCDWQVKAQRGICLPTTSQTFTRYQILADGQCSSFEDKGKAIFICGDASNGGLGGPDLHAQDPIGSSTSTDPEAGLLF